MEDKLEKICETADKYGVNRKDVMLYYGRMKAINYDEAYDNTIQFIKELALKRDCEKK